MKMRIVSADSSAAILDEKFNPLSLVASAAVLVEEPYKEAHIRLAEPIFKEVSDNYDVIVNEALLCQMLLETVKADVVHLDSNFGAVPFDELSPVELLNLKKSSKARENLLRILPKLRGISEEIRRRYGIEVLAIGKESMPVRVAELTAGSEAILYACKLSFEKKQQVLLGLPMKCEHRLADGKVYLVSLIESENNVRGYAQDMNEILEKVVLVDILNPVARGFRALRIMPKI